MLQILKGVITKSAFESLWNPYNHTCKHSSC